MTATPDDFDPFADVGRREIEREAARYLHARGIKASDSSPSESVVECADRLRREEAART